MVERVVFANSGYWFLFLVFLLGLAFCLWFKVKFKLWAISCLSSRFNFRKLLSGTSAFRVGVKAAVFSVFLILLFALSLRIQWGENQVSVDHQGRTILIALDISRSMLAKDLSPSRLEFAKIKIKNLLPSLKANRIGL